MRILAAALALALIAAAPAAAASDQESMFQDDNRLIYSPPDSVRATLDELRDLGADRLRITVLWRAVAPNPGSNDRPAFDPADPAAYPPGTWDRYDTVVSEARARGMDVNFNLTVPSPNWANRPAPRDDVVDTYEPSPDEFGRFVTAVARRFPDVHYWSIGNEPNHSGWLTPQWQEDGRGGWFERGAALYRELVDAAWGALQATGHGGDVILIGDTAPKGAASQGVKRFLKPLVFVRALYCLDEKLQPLTGTRAQLLGCAAKADFARLHPGLFAATGWAHHPYELLLPPSFRPLDRDWVTLSSLSRLTKVLDRAADVYGGARRLPLFLTEYGYQTNPPDQFGATWRNQAVFLNHAEYLAYRNRRVRSLAQFLLYDDDLRVPASFQSGLRTFEGAIKPSHGAYKLPIWISRPTVRHKRKVPVWAFVRAAPNGAPVQVAVEYRRRGKGTKWRVVRRARTNPLGYVNTSFRLTKAGEVRVAWGGVRSRRVAVRVRRSARR